MDYQAVESWTRHGYPRDVIITSYHQAGPGWAEGELRRNATIWKKMGVVLSQVASRYITDSVLFFRPEVGLVKFDIRYVILLKSVDPFEAYVYNIFWLRFSNK